MYPILKQTSDFVIIHKPPGISVHKDDSEAGLVMDLQRQLGVEQLYLVHRLDKVTSGLMVLALTQAAAAELASQFRKRKVDKYYLALSDKKPRRKQGAVVGDMEKSRRGLWKLLRSKDNPAITQFFSCSVKPGLRLFIIKPTTGKTHQIRVALKSEGAAILGDKAYGATASDRTYLHAFMLAFNLFGKPYRFVCVPETGQYFDQTLADWVVNNYSQPENLNWPVLKDWIQPLHGECKPK